MTTNKLPTLTKTDDKYIIPKYISLKIGQNQAEQRELIVQSLKSSATAQAQAKSRSIKSCCVIL
jgi:hypothetical protein